MENICISFRNIEFTFAFTGGSFASCYDPRGGMIWPAARQLGLPAPGALAFRCLAGVAYRLAQGRLESPKDSS